MELLPPLEEEYELDFDIEPAVHIRSGSKLYQGIRLLAEGLIDSAVDAEPTGRSALVKTGYEQYQNKPVEFGEEVLGYTFTDDVKAMMQSVADYVATSARSANATGKTHCLGVLVIWFFLVYGDAQVYTFAAPPEGNLIDLLWGEINRIVAENPDLFIEYEVTTLRIKRHSKSFIRGVTIPQSSNPKQIEARFSGKHAPHQLFVADEADAIPEAVFKGVDSCMSGDDNRLVMAFNPRQEAGTPYRMEKSGEANVVHLSAFNHPNVITGMNLIPGAVSRETTCRRINMWTRPLAPGEKVNSECFAVPDYLVGYVAKAHNGKPYPPLPVGMRVIINSQFSYMVLGQYPAQAENQLISRIWVENARARYDSYVARYGDVNPPGTQAIMGQDVADLGNDLNASVFRYGGFVRLPITWGGVDPIQTGDHAARLYKRYGARKCQVDGTGVGAGVSPYMRRKGCNAHRIMFASAPKQEDIPDSCKELGNFGILRDLAFWGCREWLKNDIGAMLPPDEALIEELLTPTYAIMKGNIKVMDTDSIREAIGRSPDRASALILTFCPDPPEASGLLSESSYA